MPQKATLQDLADRLGVHRSTVSLALRDHPRISPDVRQRVRALAEKIGYQVNPLVAALMQSRRTRRAVKHVVIGYVTNYPTRYGWRPPHHDRPDYFPGAAARAQELGYKLEHFWLAEPGMTRERFCDILTARGIHGLLIGRLPPGQQDISLLWDRFSCVALGMTLRVPTLDRIAEDYYSGAREAMEQILARGHRRIGFVFSEADDSPSVGERWLGAFLQRQQRLAPDDRLPPFYFNAEADQTGHFRAWFAEHRPDCLLVTHAEPVLGWLAGAGVPVPREVGLVALINDHRDPRYAGIHCSAAKLGALGAEMLVGLMQRGEHGTPVDPHEVLLTGEWCDGDTLVRAR